MKKIVIVGASSGLGLALAERFLKLGWEVGAAARRLSSLEKLKESAPERVRIAKIDVTDENAVSHLTQLIDEMGGMDVYIHCAGILKEEHDVSADTARTVAETNAVGFSMCVATAFEYFRESGREGQIVGISSIAGIRGLGDLPAYSASKAFDSTFLEALRQKADMMKLPLVVTDIKPGWTRTPLLESNRRYMLEMDRDRVTGLIFKAIMKKRKTVVIGLRWRILTAFERVVPTTLWTKLHLPLWKDIT